MPRYEKWGLLGTLHNFPTQLKLFTFQYKVLFKRPVTCRDMRDGDY